MTKYYGAKQRIEAVQVELRYHAYLQNRFFGEERITSLMNRYFVRHKKTPERVLPVGTYSGVKI